MKRTWAAIEVLAVVVWLAGQAAALTPEQICQQRKLKARGKLELCLTKSAAKVVAGLPDASATCRTKFADALTRAGTCRDVDNGDGTVSDLDTGLMWEQTDDLGGIHDWDNLYQWSTAGFPCSGTVHTHFLLVLNNGISSDGTATSGCFAGHCDWRLPTSEELQSILRAPFPCGTNPCVDPIFGPTHGFYYWTTTTWAVDPSAAWVVDFSDGTLEVSSKVNSRYVRAVRGGL